MEPSEGLKKKKLTLWDRLFNKRKLDQPQKVAVLYLRKNNNAEGLEVDTKKGFFEVHGATYHIDRDCIFKLGKDRTPLAVLEEGKLRPMGNKEFYDRLQELDGFERKSANYQDLVLKAIRHAELVKMEGSGGPKINPKVAIAIVIIAIIGFALFRSFSG